VLEVRCVTRAEAMAVAAVSSGVVCAH